MHSGISDRKESGSGSLEEPARAICLAPTIPILLDPGDPSMKTIWLGIIVLLAGLTSTAWAQESCSSDKIVGGPSGALSITEHAVVRSLGRNCPVSADDLGADFAHPRNRPVFIWFRLEGDLSFLNTVRDTDRFTARLWRNDEGTTSNELLTIRKGVLKVEDAQAEAGLNDGRFDWRFHINFNIAILPGDYRLQLFHGGRLLCLLDGTCDVRFSVHR